MKFPVGSLVVCCKFVACNDLSETMNKILRDKILHTVGVVTGYCYGEDWPYVVEFDNVVEEQYCKTKELRLATGEERCVRERTKILNKIKVLYKKNRFSSERKWYV